jgi:hypothetical protein
MTRRFASLPPVPAQRKPPCEPVGGIARTGGQAGQPKTGREIVTAQKWSCASSAFSAGATAGLVALGWTHVLRVDSPSDPQLAQFASSGWAAALHVSRPRDRRDAPAPWDRRDAPAPRDRRDAPVPGPTGAPAPQYPRTRRPRRAERQETGAIPERICIRLRRDGECHVLGVTQTSWGRRARAAGSARAGAVRIAGPAGRRSRRRSSRSCCPTRRRRTEARFTPAFAVARRCDAPPPPSHHWRRLSWQ